MEFSLRQFIAVFCIGQVFALIWMSEEYSHSKTDGAEPTQMKVKDGGSPSAKVASTDRLVTWDGESRGAKTWGDGLIGFEGQGYEGKGTACALRFMGDGWQGCGLNWKGWFPEDACDDVSKYKSLCFYIRQTTNVADADLTVHLMDNIKRPQKMPVSNGLSVLNDASITQIDGDWRKVVLPLERFARNTTLDLKRIWGIDFSHNSGKKVAFQIDRITFGNDVLNLCKFPVAPTYAAAALVKFDATTYPIRDEIYGVCDLQPEKLSYYALPIARWGGNRTSRFNWEKNADNAGKDWFYKNGGHVIHDPSHSGYAKFTKSLQSVGASSYITVPTLGFVAKDHHSYAFSVRKYGKQQSVESGHHDVGNGLLSNGTFIKENDYRDTSVQVGPNFIAEGVKMTLKVTGRTGVKYWVLDNEPMLWHETHRDVRAKPVSYDELWDMTVKYAEAIKAVDPTAKIAGFCSWGWSDLFYSAADEGGDGYRTRPDFQAHGGVPLAEWFIQKCGEYKKAHGRTVVDVFDCHWYPQAEHEGRTPYKGTGMNVEFNKLRLRTTRDLWDAKYEPESWTKHTGDGQATKLLPRVRAWIEKHNPGMEICVGEYNFGGADNITGALAQADVFGVLAREKADLAFIWNTPEGTQEHAWKLFRNHDGKGGRFGDCLIPSESNHPDVSIYTAKRSRDGATTIVLLNKNLGGACQLKLDVPGLKGKVKAFRFDQETEDQLNQVLRDIPTVDGSLNLTLPAASGTILIVE